MSGLGFNVKLKGLKYFLIQFRVSSIYLKRPVFRCDPFSPKVGRNELRIQQLKKVNLCTIRTFRAEMTIKIFKYKNKFLLFFRLKVTFVLSNILESRFQIKILSPLVY